MIPKKGTKTCRESDRKKGIVLDPEVSRSVGNIPSLKLNITPLNIGRNTKWTGDPPWGGRIYGQKQKPKSHYFCFFKVDVCKEYVDKMSFRWWGWWWWHKSRMVLSLQTLPPRIMELAIGGNFWFYLGVFQRTIGPSYAPQFYELLGGGFKYVFFNVHTYVFSNMFCFHPYLGKWSHLRNMFQIGWNHQPV